jgi:hypothetical protein
MNISSLFCFATGLRAVKRVNLPAVTVIDVVIGISFAAFNPWSVLNPELYKAFSRALS